MSEEDFLNTPGFVVLRRCAMHGWAWSVLLIIGVAGLASAVQESTYEKSVVQMLTSLDEIGKILKGIEGEEMANAARPLLRKAAETWNEARAAAAKMQPPEREEKERLTRLYKPKIEESVRKMLAEVRRVEVIPGGRDALKEIRSVLKKDEK
jgi:hypothetical protein